jgi:hypothetical protein
MAVGVPIWLVLLLVLPLAFGLGPMPSLIVATVVAVALTEVIERAVLRPLMARRREGGADGGIARAGRAFCIGLASWGILIVVFDQAGVDNPWVAALVPLVLAAGIVELVERGLVRPWRRRRAARG